MCHWYTFPQGRCRSEGKYLLARLRLFFVSEYRWLFVSILECLHGEQTGIRSLMQYCRVQGFSSWKHQPWMRCRHPWQRWDYWGRSSWHAVRYTLELDLFNQYYWDHFCSLAQDNKNSSHHRQRVPSFVEWFQRAKGQTCSDTWALGLQSFFSYPRYRWYHPL